MRLLYVCLDRGLPLGAAKGGSVHVTELVRAFEADGHDTAVLARSTAGDAYEASRPTFLATLREGPHWLPAPVLRRDLREVRGRARLSRAVEEAIERFRPDLIYERYALFRSEALDAAQSAGIPLVVEVNAPLVEEARRFHGLRLTEAAVRAERRTWRGADLVVTHLSALADLVRAAGQARVLVLPHGVDGERFAPTADGAPVRRELCLNGRFVVGWVGRPKPWHDLATLVDAVAAIPDELAPVLLVVGDGPERPALERRASAREVETRFVRAVPHFAVGRYIAAMDACVATLPSDPTLHYLSPIKALEYLSCGRPTVVAEGGDLRAPVSANAALPYRPGDSADLAARLEQIAGERGLREHLSRTGRRFAEARTWRANARAIIHAAEGLGHDRRAAPGEPRLAYVLKRFPCLSETFVAWELIELQRRSRRPTIFAMGRPDEPFTQRFLDELTARVVYLPPRPSSEPARSARALARVLRRNPLGWLRAAAESVRRPGFFGWKRLVQATILRDEMASAGIDHAHVHFANKAARLAYLSWRMGGPTYSVTAHAKDIYHRTARPPHLRKLLGSAAFVATVSDANRRYLEPIVGDRTRVEVVPNSVNLELLTANGRRHPEWTVLTVARLVEKKGTADLIEACAILSARGRRVCLAVAGDGPLRGELEAAASEAGLDAEFLGEVPHERVLELYRRARVFCLPCTVASDGDRDGLPTAILEAMGSGVPVVTTSMNGLDEAVIHERTGLIASQRDPVALADAIERVLTHSALAARLTSEARRCVEERFSTDRSTALLLRLLEEVAPATGPKDAPTTA
jgi:colanic acid/amylovoran biosynthesis glycosyltransferase